VETEVNKSIFHLPLFFLPLSRHLNKAAHLLPSLIDALKLLITQQLLGDLCWSSNILEVLFGPKTDEYDVLIIELSFCDKLKAKIVNMV